MISHPVRFRSFMIVLTMVSEASNHCANNSTKRYLSTEKEQDTESEEYVAEEGCINGNSIKRRKKEQNETYSNRIHSFQMNIPNIRIALETSQTIAMDDKNSGSSREDTQTTSQVMDTCSKNNLMKESDVAIKRAQHLTHGFSTDEYGENMTETHCDRRDLDVCSKEKCANDKNEGPIEQKSNCSGLDDQSYDEDCLWKKTEMVTYVRRGLSETHPLCQ